MPFICRPPRPSHAFLGRSVSGVACVLGWFVLLGGAGPETKLSGPLGHPRLYFTAVDLPRLRGLRTEGLHAIIWKNLAQSADWCLTRPPRSEWIEPVSPDPIYENLYDRFYAMMHDMAIMEHLAFAYAYSGDERYLSGARRWTLACCRIWQREADGQPDANKAYAVTRLLKGASTAYDILYQDLPDDERTEIRETLTRIGRKYYRYFQNPTIAGPGHNKHHGSVEAGSFGVLALALLEEVPEARDWLELMIKKHTEYLLPHALTPSGTQEQTSNFWASTMQYRLFFADALQRVTGQDLFREYEKYMSGRIGLAAVAGRKPLGPAQSQRSVLFGPSYGQLDYWSPVLIYLARRTRQPVYQRLALWDASLGAMQKTRYITANGEQLLFHMGGYAYAWYDTEIDQRAEIDAPLSFSFDEVHEAYMRASFEVGDLVVGVRAGQVILHAGGRPVFIDVGHSDSDSKTIPRLTRSDNGEVARIRCASSEMAGLAEQEIVLHRPDSVTLTRKTDEEVRWWCHGSPIRRKNTLTWPNGTKLTLTRGKLVTVDLTGYKDRKIVGMGKLKLADPSPMAYPMVTARPEDGAIVIHVRNR